MYLRRINEYRKPELKQKHQERVLYLNKLMNYIIQKEGSRE
jgi:hypothetical protein